MFTIGPWRIEQPTVLAPMAGITDLPFRQLCRHLGAGLTVSEMVTSDSRLWQSRKSQRRMVHRDDPEPRSVQLAGNDPVVMAQAAQANVAMGAQVIDINMGCPAKKVCKKAAGSALLRDEKLVAAILTAVVNAVAVPVTLKIRTGWDTEHRNGVKIAQIAEDAGIQALAVHGRTRACAFKGEAEYDTIAEIASRISIPVLANGDIRSPQQARAVLAKTGAKAVMIGRGAQGNPWLFREINHFLASGKALSKPGIEEVHNAINRHLQGLHDHYGDIAGVRIARKHVAWYLQNQATLWNNYTIEQDQNTTAIASNPLTPAHCAGDRITEFRRYFNKIESAQEQYDAVQSYFEIIATKEEKAA